MSYITRKDRYLQEAIELLDTRLEQAQGNTRQAYSLLNKTELEIVDQEITKCHDFRYYAENYHLIASKTEGLKTLYPFWESQEIFYERVVDLQRRRLPVQILCLKARQLGLCLDPNTLVLTSDLQWIPIDKIEVGQEVVTVDEGKTSEEWKKEGVEYQRRWKAYKEGSGAKWEPKEEKKLSRKMRTGTVLAKREVHEFAFKLTMDNGRILIVTPQHKFLCSPGAGPPQPRWVLVAHMRVGDRIKYVTVPWQKGDWEDAWFGGLVDGEGCLRRKEGGGTELSVAQVLDNGIYDRAARYLKSSGYTFREEVDRRKGGSSSKLGNKPVGKLVVNRSEELFRIIGQTRPTRFIGWPWWEGKDLPGKKIGHGYSKIVSIELLPMQRMIDLQTTTKTFIAEGFVSHNSTLAEALIFHKTIFNEACNTLIVAQDPSQADYLFGMTRLAYDSLPWWMRPEDRYQAKQKYLQFDRRNDVERMQNPGLRSQIIVEAANKYTGVAVGKAIRAAHLSELSDWPDPKILTEQIFPTMNVPDELAILESTARGRHNFWHKFWCDAVDKKVDWIPVFIEFFRLKQYSSLIPVGYDFKRTDEEIGLIEKIKETASVELTNEQLYWRRKTMATFVALQGDESKFFQEFPGSTWMEAFQGSGVCAFNKKHLQKILETTCHPPLYYAEIELGELGQSGNRIPKLKSYAHRKGEDPPSTDTPGARLRIWEYPAEDETYYVGADVAHGLVGRDYSVAEVIRIGRRNQPDVQVAEWHGWENPTPFAHIVAALGYWYNGAQISVECNDIGLTTNSELIRVIEYPNIFRWKHYDKIKNFITDFTGWFTNSKTRDLIIAKFRERIADNTVILRSEWLIDECFDFTQMEQGGKFKGWGTHDDRVFAAMIALFCAHDSEWGMQAAMQPRGPQAERADAKAQHAKITGHQEFRELGGIVLCAICGAKIYAVQDFVNTDWSTSESGRQVRHSLGGEREVPKEVLMYQESEESERWKLF